MAITYEVTLTELRRIHEQQAKACIKNRLFRTFVRPFIPKRWKPPLLIREWVTWTTLVALCRRREGFTVAHGERGEEFNYRLATGAAALAPERHVRDTRSPRS